MRVLKITAEGLITSFRYPHFMQEVQPTFEMPPPATIYGHICSVLGKWFDPDGVQFALHFTYQAKFEDIEHTHVLTPAAGKLPGTNLPKVNEGKVAPFRRGLLFKPKMMLYVNKPEWAEAFRHPRYPVALGRSQDLFTYTDVEIVELERADHAYFEHTLAPYSFARRTASGFVVLMPRFLDYSRNRFPTFGRYVVIHRRVHSHDFLRFAGEDPLSFWVDPTSEEVKGDKLGLAFHSWVGEDESIVRMA
ncbi:MAG: CRISPR-associated protein Cas5 [Chloroflexi bacterium]|nr:CRISPR-associated protein Cas5 [Chloroflexota bacterium]